MELHKVIVAEMTRLAGNANRARETGQSWLADWYVGRIEGLRAELLRAYLARREEEGRAA